MIVWDHDPTKTAHSNENFISAYTKMTKYKESSNYQSNLRRNDDFVGSAVALNVFNQANS